ncbi:MAG: methionyl-tRNA formyltransferase [Acidobacteriota bacterium]
MRLAFMGTPQFAIPALQRLLSSTHQVTAVITQPDRPAGRGEPTTLPPVKRLAQEAGIPVHQPERLLADQYQAVFEQLEIDAWVVVAYGKILPDWLINLPRFGALNIHASLLPKYRGAAPVHWAIANGETHTGITIMQIDSGMDTGPVLLQEKVAIRPDESVSELQARLAQKGADLLLSALKLAEQNQLVPVAQNHREASYAPILKKADGQLHWRESAEALYNRVRAFNPWPGTYTFLKGAIFRIWDARPLPFEEGDYPVGSLFVHPKHEVVVQCGTGLLKLLEVQLENRRRLPSLEFANGFRLRACQPLLLGR